MIGRDCPPLMQQGSAGGMSLANRRLRCRQAVCFPATPVDNRVNTTRLVSGKRNCPGLFEQRTGRMSKVNMDTTIATAERGQNLSTAYHFCDANADAGEAFEMRTIDFLRGVLDLLAGPAHGLRVCLYSGIDGESVEIAAPLPSGLRQDLRRIVDPHEPIRRRSKRVPPGRFTWRTPRGIGFAVPSLPALCALLGERRLSCGGAA